MKCNGLQAAGMWLAVSMWFSSSSAAPVAAPLTARELVEIRELSSLSVSPDGAHAAVRVDQRRVGTNRIELAWYVVATRTGEAVRVADAGGPLFVSGGSLAFQAAQWSADSLWIYYLAEEGQQLQVWRARRDGGLVEQVTHDAADIEEFVVDSAAGKLHYTVRATRAAILEAERLEYERGIMMDDSVLYGFALTRSFPINGRMASYRVMAPTKRDYWNSTLLGDAPKTAYTLDLSTRQVTPSHLSLMKPPAQDNAISAKCLHKMCTDADRVAVSGWAPGNREAVLLIEDFGVQGLYGWDVAKNTLRKIFADEGTYGADPYGVTACPLVAGEAVCIASAADIPPRLLAIDLKSGKRRTLLDPNPELTPQRLGKAQTITLTDRSGGKAFARLVLPRQHDPRMKLPLVITSYSCPGFLRGGGGADVPEHILAQRGFAALCVETSWKHHHAGRAVTGETLMRREAGILPSFEVFEDAIDVLDRSGLIDTARVAVTGLSHSSSVVTYAISRSRRFTTAIITARGFLDPVDYFAANFRPGIKKPPNPYEDPAAWARLSPAMNADAIEAPLLMQMPENEYMSMMQLFSTLKDKGKGVEMIVYADEDHIKRQPIHRLAVYDSNVAWLEFWLKGLEPGDPLLARRSAKWRLMREAQCERLKGERTPWYCKGLS